MEVKDYPPPPPRSTLSRVHLDTAFSFEPPPPPPWQDWKTGMSSAEGPQAGWVWSTCSMRRCWGTGPRSAWGWDDFERTWQQPAHAQDRARTQSWATTVGPGESTRRSGLKWNEGRFRSDTRKLSPLWKYSSIGKVSPRRLCSLHPSRFSKSD